MITNIKVDRMLVISDLHVGSTYFAARQRTINFLNYAADHGYHLCLNGDGLEIAQGSITSVAVNAPDVLAAFRRLLNRGLKVYYVIGNHDIVLEHFWTDTPQVVLSPFLNVHAGKKRIRVEHGHLYDPNYLERPEFYEWVTRMAGVALRMVPSIYKLYLLYARYANRPVGDGKDHLLLPDDPLIEAAEEIAERGFDMVVFGHTHQAGRRPLRDGRLYYNTGAWLGKPYYLEITGDSVEFKLWDKKPVTL